MGRQHGVKHESILDGVRTLCKCPKCDGLHYVYMNFTGRGMPRKFCDVCKQNIEICGYHHLNDACGRVLYRRPQKRGIIPQEIPTEELPFAENMPPEHTVALAG